MAKLKYGDLVKAGPHDAIVLYSLKKYGTNSDSDKYGIIKRHIGESAPHDENDLLLIKKGCHCRIDDWVKEIEADRLIKSDLDWIFENGEDVITNMYHQSIETLGRYLGISNLWQEGDYYSYYNNSKEIIRLSRQFLLSGNKDLWLKLCENRNTLDRQ